MTEYTELAPGTNDRKHRVFVYMNEHGTVFLRYRLPDGVEDDGGHCMYLEQAIALRDWLGANLPGDVSLRE